MPKTFTAHSVKSVNPLHFKVEGTTVVALICNVDVNYGELGMTHQIDLWPILTEAQKDLAQTVYDFLRTKAEKHFMGL